MQGCHLLDDDVVRTADDSETLALDDTVATSADDGLVGLDGYGEGAGLVTGAVSQYAFQKGHSLQSWGLGLFVLVDIDNRRFRLVVGAPVVLVDGNLATRAITPREAAGAFSRSF